MGGMAWLEDSITGIRTAIGELTSGDSEEGEAFTMLNQKVHSELQVYIMQLTSTSSSSSLSTA